MPNFTLDITQGKSRAELADNYLRCSRAAFRWQWIALWLVSHNPFLLEQMPKEYREDIERAIEAYKD